MNKKIKRGQSIIGERFGRLLVLSKDGIYVTCECDCGVIKATTRSSLLSGDTRSCGCLRSEKLKQRHLKTFNKKKIRPGTTFGRLTVRKNNRQYCECICICGTNKNIYKYDLLNGKTNSCGCLSREISAESARKAHTIHGMSATKEWNTWHHMIQRCHNPKTMGYENYGDKGIRVCDEWRDKNGFQKFLDHIGKAPSKEHSIDRIDNKKGYEPGNVRWATSKEQGRNRTNNHLITINGRTQCMAAWVEETGVSAATISFRLKKGWEPEKAITKRSVEELAEINKKRARNRKNNALIGAFGKVQCASVWAEEVGIPGNTILTRIKAGWMPEKALTVEPGVIKNYHGNFASKKLVGGQLRTKLKEYYNWSAFVKRANKEQIYVSERWLGDDGFENFYNDVGCAPTSKHRIRILNKENGYQPGNVSWALIKEITSNRSNVIKLMAFGRTQTLAEWVKETGIGRTVIKDRLKRGWDVERALSEKPLNRGKKK